MPRYSKIFVNSVLLFTVPSITLYSQGTPTQVTCPTQRINSEEKKTESRYTPSYDEIIRLLDEIESGELEKRCTPEELERIIHFIAFLAKEGTLTDDSEESLSLDEDIEELLNGTENPNENAYPFGSLDAYQYMIFPVILNGNDKIVLCKSWAQKQWDHVKKFAKKHKKALIIGAVVVVAAAAVVVAVAAAATTAGAAAASAVGAAVSSDSDKSGKKEPKEEFSFYSTAPIDIPHEIAGTAEAPTLKSVIDNQIYSFKEHIIKEQFFQPATQTIQHQGLSWEENGRTLGSLFAHDSLKNLEDQIPDHPRLAQEILEIGSKHLFLIPGDSIQTVDFGHPEIDRIFSTDYTSLYAPTSQEIGFNILSYQVRGESALAHGYYEQAVQDLGKAIELNPTNPIPYLERGVANFGLGNYDQSLADYHHFTSQAQKTQPISIPDFSLGFAKGLPKGIYESGRGILVLLSDVVNHPIHTGEQIWNTLTFLSGLARSEQWDALSEVLAPEVHQLVKEWDAIPSEMRGELAGYVFGKYGSDILIPGALAKAVSNGLKGAQKLNIAYRGLKTAEQTLLLESVAGLETGAKIAEVVQLEKQISGWLGDGTQFMRNKAGDPVFLSNDGLRKLRFDFNRPAPHESPHLHFEHLVDGEWQEIDRIYPIDVPHK